MDFRVPGLRLGPRCSVSGLRRWTGSGTRYLAECSAHASKTSTWSLRLQILTDPVCTFFGTGTGNSVKVPAFHPGTRTRHLEPGTYAGFLQPFDRAAGRDYNFKADRPERCPSGRRSTAGNRVPAVRRVVGSNPTLSATAPARGYGSRAMAAREPRQARKGATVSGVRHAPRGCLYPPYRCQASVLRYGCRMQDAGCKMQDTGCRMQDADPVCGFFEDRYPVPGTGFGGRPSVLGLDKGGGKVVPPSPLIPPWPRAGYRAPRTENAHTGYAGIDGQGSDYLVPGTGYLAPVPHSHIVLPDCPRPDDCKNTLFTGSVTTPIRPWSVFQGVRPWRVCRPLCR